MVYRFARVEDDSIKRYEFESFEEAKTFIDKEIEKFKKINEVKENEKDKHFLRFKEEMKKILISSDHLKCKKCSDSDHEGQFCRCEDRNIRIAKEKREKDEFLRNNPFIDK